MRPEQAGFLFLIIVAIYGIVSTLLMPLGEPREPGPGLFPLCLSGLLFLLASIGLMVSRSAKYPTSSWREFWGNLQVPAKIVICSATAIFFFESLGFLIISIFFLFLLFSWVSGFSAWRALILGMAGGLIGWFLFVKMLGVSLPEGIFGL